MKKQGDAGGCRQMYRPERPKGAKDKVKRPFLPFLPILHCRGAKPAAAKPPGAKPAASKADCSRPRQTIADQGRCLYFLLSARVPKINQSMQNWKVSLKMCVCTQTGPSSPSPFVLVFPLKIADLVVQKLHFTAFLNLDKDRE